jgi:hypothetical protein
VNFDLLYESNRQLLLLSVPAQSLKQEEQRREIGRVEKRRRRNQRTCLGVGLQFASVLLNKPFSNDEIVFVLFLTFTNLSMSLPWNSWSAILPHSRRRIVCVRIFSEYWKGAAGNWLKNGPRS